MKSDKRMAGRKSRTEPENESVRHRLLAAATDLFTQKGYAATTVREIVGAAGVTKPVLYYYFRNKEGIYLELMREAFAQAGRTDRRHRQGIGGARPRDFCASATGLTPSSRKMIKVARVMYAIYYGPHQGAPFFDFDAYHHEIPGSRPKTH